MTRKQTGILILALLVIVVAAALLNQPKPSAFQPGATETAQAQPSPAASQTTPPDVPTQVSPDAKRLLGEFTAAFEQAAKKVNPSVVPIFSEATVTMGNPFGLPDSQLRQFFGNQLYQRFFGSAPGQEKRTVHALGSGVIVSPDGYILTNNHVVEGADQLTIMLANGDQKTARVIGTDPHTDIALIKVDAKNLPAATLGNSDNIRVGEWVIAVGNPFQLLHTTTAGIISAKGRSSMGLADYEDFIQTDAAINPGNSGGALANLDGEVIGINAAISTPTGASIGLGFAIPINMAKAVMAQLKDHGKVIRGFLGVSLQTLTPDLAKALGLDHDVSGVLIGDVVSGAPADQAGIERGDVITQFNGQAVSDVIQLRNTVAAMQPGTEVEVGLLRSGKQKSVSVKLAEQPQQREAANPSPAPPSPQSPATFGIAIQTLTPEIAAELGYQGESGAVITEVKPGSVAENAGLQRGDLIKEINHGKVRTAQDLATRLHRLHSGDSAALLVRRGKNTFYVALVLP